MLNETFSVIFKHRAYYDTSTTIRALKHVFFSQVPHVITPRFVENASVTNSNQSSDETSGEEGNFLLDELSTGFFFTLCRTCLEGRSQEKMGVILPDNAR